MFGTSAMESEMHDTHERIVLKIEALKAENEKLAKERTAFHDAYVKQVAENERLQSLAEAAQRQQDRLVAERHTVTVPAGAKVTIEYPQCNV